MQCTHACATEKNSLPGATCGVPHGIRGTHGTRHAVRGTHSTPKPGARTSRERVPCVPRTVWHPTGGAGQALLLGGAGVCTAYYLPIYYSPIYDSLLAYLLTAYYGSTPAWRSSTRPLSCSTCARGSMCYSAHSGRWCVALFLTLNVSTHECTHAPIHQCTNA